MSAALLVSGEVVHVCPASRLRLGDDTGRCSVKLPQIGAVHGRCARGTWEDYNEALGRSVPTSTEVPNKHDGGFEKVRNAFFEGEGIGRAKRLANTGQPYVNEKRPQRATRQLCGCLHCIFAPGAESGSISSQPGRQNYHLGCAARRDCREVTEARRSSILSTFLPPWVRPLRGTSQDGPRVR